MIEVEAKVRLSKSQFTQIKKKLETEALFKRSFIKKDFYIGDREVHIRIRNDNQKSIMTLKQQKKIEGIEINNEIEIDLKNDIKLKKLLKKIGKLEPRKKVKKGSLYSIDEASIEIAKVVSVGYFLEIEIPTKYQKDIKKNTQLLKALFKKFGFSHHQFDRKYYLEQISQ